MKKSIYFFVLGLLAPLFLAAQGSVVTRNTSGGQTPTQHALPQVSNPQPSTYNGGQSRVAQPQTQQPASYSQPVVRQSPIAAKYARGSVKKTDPFQINVTTNAPPQAKSEVPEVPAGGGVVIHPEKKIETQVYDISSYDLGHRSKPVIYLKNNQSRYYHPSGYGVQIAYYKDISQCRRDLAKYRHYFKIAGFVAEDYNLDEYRFRLILGRYTHATAAGRLLIRLRTYFPFCFVVRYA